ncbi:MAG: iron-only hydrogenase system regulator [Alphaproteobacteria bacterium]|nr:iron-only hydrogenase system regulator [Alphaproteobacteria bacterium]
METKVAVIAIIVENRDSAESLNAILSEYGEYIIGRMGIPYKAKKINIISVVVDAPHDVISAMAGKIGNLQDVTVKTAYSGCN